MVDRPENVGAGDQAQILGAILPRMMRQVRENLMELSSDDVDSVSISAGERRLTVIEGGDIHVSVFHASNRLTTSMHKLLRGVASELHWLLSYRGYVSEASDGDAREP